MTSVTLLKRFKNGWQRLWFVCAVVGLLPVIVVAWQSYSFHAPRGTVLSDLSNKECTTFLYLSRPPHEGQPRRFSDDSSKHPVYEIASPTGDKWIVVASQSIDERRIVRRSKDAVEALGESGNDAKARAIVLPNGQVLANPPDTVNQSDILNRIVRQDGHLWEPTVNNECYALSSLWFIDKEPIQTQVDYINWLEMKQRRELVAAIGTGFLVWAVIVGLVYLIGLAIAWVVAGFRNPSKQ